MPCKLGKTPNQNHLDSEPPLQNGQASKDIIKLAGWKVGDPRKCSGSVWDQQNKIFLFGWHPFFWLSFRNPVATHWPRSRISVEKKEQRYFIPSVSGKEHWKLDRPVSSIWIKLVHFHILPIPATAPWTELASRFYWCHQQRSAVAVSNPMWSHWSGHDPIKPLTQVLKYHSWHVIWHIFKAGYYIIGWILCHNWPHVTGWPYRKP